MRTADFNFELPAELIAQAPAPERDQSRLLVLHRDSAAIEHRQFRDILGYVREGDVLILNNSRVIPARLRGNREESGGSLEILLLEQNAVNDWWALVRPGKRAAIGTRIRLRDLRGEPGNVCAIVCDRNPAGHRRVRFEGTPDIAGMLDEFGEVPLPHYIKRAAGGSLEEDKRRYQTVFALPPGSVAAPTAGLHFTTALLTQLSALGVQVGYLTLHVGPGTFVPVKTETVSAHRMHEERYELDEKTARMVNDAKQSGRRVIAVGTTTVRVLESVAAKHQGPLTPESGRTDIFIFPPYEFRVVDVLLTNFHLPCSTLLMLVSAFAAPRESRGREIVLSAYAEAIRQRYRFFSYGDAMLVV